MDTLASNATPTSSEQRSVVCVLCVCFILTIVFWSFELVLLKFLQCDGYLFVLFSNSSTAVAPPATVGATPTTERPPATSGATPTAVESFKTVRATRRLPKTVGVTPTASTAEDDACLQAVEMGDDDDDDDDDDNDDYYDDEDDDDDEDEDDDDDDNDDDDYHDDDEDEDDDDDDDDDYHDDEDNEITNQTLDGVQSKKREGLADQSTSSVAIKETNKVRS